MCSKEGSELSKYVLSLAELPYDIQEIMSKMVDSKALGSLMMTSKELKVIHEELALEQVKRDPTLSKVVSLCMKAASAYKAFIEENTETLKNIQYNPVLELYVNIDNQKRKRRLLKMFRDEEGFKIFVGLDVVVPAIFDDIHYWSILYKLEVFISENKPKGKFRIVSSIDDGVSPSTLDRAENKTVIKKYNNIVQSFKNICGLYNLVVADASTDIPRAIPRDIPTDPRGLQEISKTKSESRKNTGLFYCGYLGNSCVYNHTEAVKIFMEQGMNVPKALEALKKADIDSRTGGRIIKTITKKKTDERVTIGNRIRVVYRGTHGAKYVKINGKFQSLRKI